MLGWSPAVDDPVRVPDDDTEPKAMSTGAYVVPVPTSKLSAVAPDAVPEIEERRRLRVKLGPQLFLGCVKRDRHRHAARDAELGGRAIVRDRAVPRHQPLQIRLAPDAQAAQIAHRRRARQRAEMGNGK